MSLGNRDTDSIYGHEEVPAEEEAPGDCEKRNGINNQTPKEYFQPEKPVVKALKKDTFLIVCLVLMVSVLTVCSQRLPGYLRAVNWSGGSAYGALVFVSLASFVVAWMVAVVFLLARGRPGRSADNAGAVHSWKFNVKTGVLLGLSGLVIFYARDRDRVPCHLQEPLTILFLPAVFMVSLLRRGMPGVRGLRKLDVLFVVGTFFGLFLCIDTQLLDPAYCYGKTDRRGQEDKDLWTTKTSILWSITYVGGLALFAYIHVALETYLTEEMKVSDSSVDEEVALLIRTKKIYQKLSNCITRVAWIQTFALITVLSLFWTDIFVALGKDGSIEQVGRLMRTTFQAHFEDTGVMECGWPLVPCYVLFLLLLTYTLPYAAGRTESIAVTELFAVPLTIFISAVLQGFVPETGFAIVGFIVLLATVLYYYFQGIFQARRRTVYDEI